ncbi:MAG: hypothetical protein KGM16_01430 [Bacteroidota bacterium]|nr:hypothetical protein [Bacteroidota bacterium]
MNRLSRSVLKASFIIAAVLFFMGCEKADRNLDTPTNVSNAKGGGGKGGGEVTSVGSNLSFPVLWAEGGLTLPLRVPPSGYDTNSVVLNGAWWYVWGVDPIDPSSPIYSCQPSPSNELVCLNETTPGDGTSTIYRAYLQKDANNYWQATTLTAGTGEKVNVDSVDWGDNLESSDWTLNSKVRTEVVLVKKLASTVKQFAMRHTSGWGVDEMHGLQTTSDKTVQYGLGDEATIYSRHARLTIQKLTKTDPILTWNTSSDSWTGDGAGTVVFSSAVWQAGDGPGFYNAEVNIKGKVIYGYTWDANKFNDGAGEYRITFSFDGDEAGTILNTFLTNNTGIIGSSEIVAAEEGAGNTAHIDATNNLTYIDVALTGRGGGGGGGKGGGKGGR